MQQLLTDMAYDGSLALESQGMNALKSDHSN
jgi:hypothetical protein